MNVIPVVVTNKISQKEIKEALGAERVEFIDWDKFYHIYPKEGRPMQDPEWPSNFIKAVRCLVYETEGLEAYKDLRYVFINAGPKPLSYLVDDKIPFVITMPRVFGENYTPIDYYQDLNEEYLKLDMPMVYLNDDEFIDIFKRESMYRYFVDKTDFVEAYRFGTCVFTEDLDEYDEVFGRLQDEQDSNDSVEREFDDIALANTAQRYCEEFTTNTKSEYFIKDSSGNITRTGNGVFESIHIAELCLLENPEEIYTISSSENEDICKVCIKEKDGTHQVVIQKA